MQAVVDGELNMVSSFTWLDYSESDRRRMMDVISAFSEPETRDELGIGVVRDALADILFPGTSTIQTRARYFFFVPWIYLDAEQRAISSAEISSFVRKREVALIDALAESKDSDGTIGTKSRENLQRLPSNIYWIGLGRLGIRLFRGSQSQYHRYLDTLYILQERSGRNDDGEPMEGNLPACWHAALPQAPKGFPKEASFALRREEADYLRERIMAHAKGSLMAWLVDKGLMAEQVKFPWEHSQYADFPDSIRERLEHGRNFSEAIHGAALLYNLMIAEQDTVEDRKEDRISTYTSTLNEWCNMIEERSAVFSRWDRGRFWMIILSEGARISGPTRMFIDAWLDMAMSQDTARNITKDDRARSIIHERERYLKRGLARLDNQRARELWSGASGIGRLDYRWHIVQQIVSDILKGLM